MTEPLTEYSLLQYHPNTLTDDRVTIAVVYNSKNNVNYIAHERNIRLYKLHDEANYYLSGLSSTNWVAKKEFIERSSKGTSKIRYSEIKKLPESFLNKLL